jgi:cytochrome c biogenesis protein
MHESALMQRLLVRCASTRLTVALLMLLAAGVIGGYAYEPIAAGAVMLPLGLLTLNLAAAAVMRPVFRSQLPLLVAHLALAALVLLAGFGRLSALQGRVEVTQGVEFDGRLLDVQAGPLHRPRLEQAKFINEGFEIEYAPGLKRGRTRNAVRWTDAQGRVRRAVIGDHEPLVLAGYRFYTTPNKGYAPVFTWRTGAGDVQGAVHLPSYPAHRLRQARAWTLPDETAVWVMLKTEETVIDPEKPAAFALPRDRDVVLRIGDDRLELTPGDRVALPGGTLIYEGLRTWMGYRVYYDPMLPWMLVASVLAALALAVHFALKFKRQSWRSVRPASDAPTGDAQARPVAVWQ